VVLGLEYGPRWPEGKLVCHHLWALVEVVDERMGAIQTETATVAAGISLFDGLPVEDLNE
jgi:hypothetical protein